MPLVRPAMMVASATHIAVDTARATLPTVPSLKNVIFCIFGDNVTVAYQYALAE